MKKKLQNFKLFEYKTEKLTICNVEYYILGVSRRFG
jgi:hypothetical protein